MISVEQVVRLIFHDLGKILDEVLTSSSYIMPNHGKIFTTFIKDVTV